MNDYPCVVYDHECSGQSQKSDVRNVLFSHWVEDALAVVDRLTEVRINFVITAVHSSSLDLDQDYGRLYSWQHSEPDSNFSSRVPWCS